MKMKITKKEMYFKKELCKFLASISFTKNKKVKEVKSDNEESDVSSDISADGDSSEEVKNVSKKSKKYDPFEGMSKKVI